MKVITPNSVFGAYDVFNSNGITYVICPYIVELNVENSTQIICPHKHTRVYYKPGSDIIINNTKVLPNVYDIPKRKLAFSTLEKNSSKLMFHWLTYHSKLGADFFLIYDNNSSTDEFEKLVKECEKFDGFIFRWNYPYCYSGPTQQTQQNHSLYLAKNNIHRIALTDLDEYIVPYGDNNFEQIIKEHKIVYLYWLYFGYHGERQTDPRLYTKCKRVREPMPYTKMIIDPCNVDLVSAHSILLPSNIGNIHCSETILLHHYMGLSWRPECTSDELNCENCVRYNYELANKYKY